MNDRRFITLGLSVVLLVAADAAAASNSSEGVRAPLPRTFQNVRLGMSIGDLARHYPQHTGLHRKRHDHLTVVLPSTDRHVRNLEGRFFSGSLYELVIVYRPDRLPRGPASLVERLKEQYGPPLIDGQEESDYERRISSEKKTVWSDAVTRITFVERRKFGDITPSELVVQITDLATERLRALHLQEQKRQRELAIPVPTAEGQSLLGRTAGSALHDEPHAASRTPAG